MTIPIARLASLGVVLLLLACAPAAMGAGLNLFWNDCGNSSSAVTNRNFACNTNSGANVLTISFDPLPGVTALSAINWAIDLQSATATLPQWWRYRNPGTCRETSLSANTSFGIDCPEPWLTPGAAAIAAYMETYGGDPSRARIVGTVTAPPSGEAPVDPGTEYYATNVTIDNTRTVGTDNCAGCLVGVCLVLLEVRLVQPAPDPSFSIKNPRDSNYATWQGGAINTFGCPGGSPTVNRTWGQVKGLYR